MHQNNDSRIDMTAEERNKRDQWVASAFGEDGAPPFSFVYGGQASAGLLKTWPRSARVQDLPDGRVEQTVVWNEAGSGLEVRCMAVTYDRFPVVEWTVYFKNTREAATPIIEQIQALDISIEREERWPAAGGEFILHHQRGDYCTPDSYEPFSQQLPHNLSLSFAPLGGRPTNSAFPYYNVEMPGGGVIVAVGWPGQWAASFTRNAGRRLQIRAGQELTHLSLQPGEEIRTPLMALLFWGESGERESGPTRAQNLWRRWMVAHNLPQDEGRPPRPMYTFCDGGFFPNLKCSEAGEKAFIDTLQREGVQFDYWWMDAGWYPCDNWPTVGTWEPDPERFPHGLKAVGDHVHALGSRLIVWFEPERVAPGTWLYEQHPQWLLAQADGAAQDDWPRRMRLLNLGDPAARDWVIEHVDHLLVEHGIDLYRQDFNIDPLEFWRANDARLGPDRQGITENLYVQGYLAYWDELRRRHPGMLIDSCASGGRRNDLETLRRAVPLLRSDYQSFQGDPGYAPGNQGHTYGLSPWIPYYGQGVYYNADQYVYSVRSYLSPAFCMAVDVRQEGIDWDLYRRMLAQWRTVADCFLGDFYPLTPYSLETDSWIAWQFDLPDQGRGMLQVFRHAEAREAGRIFHLYGLDPAAEYQVEDADRDAPLVLSGRALMEDGLPVSLAARPAAALITYRRT